MNIRTEARDEPRLLDKSQFLARAEGRDRRYELSDGRAVMLAYVTRAHSRICNNIIQALGSRLDPARFDIAQGDFAVETSDRSLRCADVMIEPVSDVLSARTTRNAAVLIEVLSPSTLHVDFHEKLDEYTALPTVGSYLVCAQDAARVWVWTRSGDGWPVAPDIVENLDAVIDIPVLRTGLSLREIYRNIPAAETPRRF